MDKKEPLGKRISNFMAGKGFYIVLFLCIAVIGVTSWFLLYASKEPETDLDLNDLVNDPTDNSVDVDLPSTDDEPDLPVIAEPEEPEASPSPEAPAVSEDPAVSPSPVEEAPEDDALSEIISSTFVWPVTGTIELPYAMETLVYDRTMADWRTHNGIDIGASLGTEVKAVSAGTVERVYEDPLYGTTVVISHSGGLQSVYANLAALPTVAEGDSVTPGQVIGSIGSTAIAESGDSAHLHFSMTLDGASVDPTEYLP